MTTLAFMLSLLCPVPPEPAVAAVPSVTEDTERVAPMRDRRLRVRERAVLDKAKDSALENRGRRELGPREIEPQPPRPDW